MIKEFLRKGEQYPGLDHLVPIDRDGHQIQDWVNSPLPVRRDYVPHEAILGKGMFGTVWRAMDSRSGQWYAVKKNHTYRQATVAREREVTNHVLMNPHPFIVQIFGNHFIESGTGFSSLVMEFCAGGDLQDKVNAGEGGAIKSLRVEKKTYPKKQATSQKKAAKDLQSSIPKNHLQNLRCFEGWKKTHKETFNSLQVTYWASTICQKRRLRGWPRSSLV